MSAEPKPSHQLTGQQQSKKRRLVPRVVEWTVLTLGFVFGATFLAYHPALPDIGDSIAVVLWCGAGISLAWASLWRRRIIGGALIAALVLSGYVVSPKSDAEWNPDQARVARIERDGSRVRIENVRDFRYLTKDDYEERWIERLIDLSPDSGTAVRSVDYVVVPFVAGVRGIAHVALSFGFEDGRTLAFSLEIRREVGETYSPIGGLFRNYETTTVLGEEIDVLGLRSTLWELPVYVYPTRATPEQARQLFESILDVVERVEANAEFYNTLSNNCSTPIIEAVANLLGKPIALQLRTLLPGHSDSLALENRWIDFDGDLDAARTAFRIPIVPFDGHTPESWSRAIRQERATHSKR